MFSVAMLRLHVSCRWCYESQYKYIQISGSAGNAQLITLTASFSIKEGTQKMHLYIDVTYTYTKQVIMFNVTCIVIKTTFQKCQAMKPRYHIRTHTINSAICDNIRSSAAEYWACHSYYILNGYVSISAWIRWRNEAVSNWTAFWYYAWCLWSQGLVSNNVSKVVDDLSLMSSSRWFLQCMYSLSVTGCVFFLKHIVLHSCNWKFISWSFLMEDVHLHKSARYKVHYSSPRLHICPKNISIKLPINHNEYIIYFFSLISFVFIMVTIFNWFIFIRLIQIVYPKHVFLDHDSRIDLFVYNAGNVSVKSILIHWGRVTCHRSGNGSSPIRHQAVLEILLKHRQLELRNTIFMEIKKISIEENAFENVHKIGFILSKTECVKI